MVRMSATKEEVQKIVEITKRVVKEVPQMDFMSTMMDIEATHSNGCKLKLDELISADLGDLLHDVTGIYNHIDRNTGELQDCFLPRFAA